MTGDLETFRDTASHRRPARFLYEARFTPDLRRRMIEHIGSDDIAGHYGFWQPAGLSVKRPEGVEPPDYSAYWDGEDLPGGTTINALGVAMAPSGLYHFWGYISPLRNVGSLSEIEDYPLEDASALDYAHWPAEVENAHGQGKAVQLSVGHMYEDAWQIRGYEQFLMDTVERPAWAECLLERLWERNMVRAVAAAGAGVDYVYGGDDVANQNALMFSKDTWRKLILSRWGKLWARVKEIHPAATIGYHTDGNCIEVVDEMVEAGLDFLNPVQPECLDADEIYRRHKGRLGLHGCIGTQSTMPFGTADDVRNRVKECIDKYGESGGLILAPTHVLEPEVPLANIEAFAEACREYGRV